VEADEQWPLFNDREAILVAVVPLGFASFTAAVGCHCPLPGSDTVGPAEKIRGHARVSQHAVERLRVGTGLHRLGDAEAGPIGEGREDSAAAPVKPRIADPNFRNIVKEEIMDHRRTS
jgi:hypothetical protein